MFLFTSLMSAGGSSIAPGGLADDEFIIDFVNDSYMIGSTDYTLADVITNTSLVTVGVGLVIPTRASSPGIQEILGPFNDRLILGEYTLIIDATNLLSTLNGNSVFLNIQNNDLSAALQIYTNASGGVNLDVKADDYDGGVNNLVGTFSEHYDDSAEHKIAIVRNNFSLPIAIAVDGTLQGWAEDSPIPSASWTKSCFGGDYDSEADSCRNGITIRSLTCLAPVPLGELAALSVI